jgi:hypothetical protein
LISLHLQIRQRVSRSRARRSHVFYPGSRVTGILCASPIDPGFSDPREFNLDISYWANSSSQVPVCSVEPRAPVDVASMVTTLAVLLTFFTSTNQQINIARVSFAVKGGGYATNSGFSSTPGVHISMTRFNDIATREDSRTRLDLTLTDVYTYLDPKGLNGVQEWCWRRIWWRWVSFPFLAHLS